MHFQSTSYNCGPASLQNALELLGVVVTQRKCAAACGTTREGTDEFGIMRGIDHFALKHSEVRRNKAQRAYAALRSCWPKLLCVDRWSHWVCVLPAPHRNRFLLVDPSRPAKKTWAHSPAKVVAWQTLERRWRAAIRDVRHIDPRYYGIEVYL